MIALDTNVIVRYIVQDDKEQARKASAVIEALSSERQAFISCIVLCEVNWVLKTAYNTSKEECVTVLKRILSVSAFDVERMVCCMKALRRYEKESADFSDYLIYEIAKEEGYEAVVTFDRNAQKSDGFQTL
jgi:predicted nucleic-acid-binding protein